ncbi:VOC family protein [Roseovarius sp. EL26]|uniref:VOC family protein n=1 Tax=Roseovarius sp. EL26 TaxID=2126672 RepID=UPI000EA35370|nr:VOC family protein [Roseovarius sp. EL26]
MKKPAIRPRGYTTITASVAVDDVAATIEFLNAAFGAEVQVQDDADAPSFASLKIGNAMLFVTRGWAAHGHMPQSYTASSAVSLHLYVDDVVAMSEQAIAAGATLLSAPTETYWGELTAALADPFGQIWTVAERVEALTGKDIAARRDAVLAVNDPVDAQPEA